MVFTTYPLKHERPVTRAEIDRLTAIIAQLNDALDACIDREDRLRHEIELQRARAEVAEALVRRAGEQRGDEPLVGNWAELERE